jgi:hypothetical protein
MKKDQSESFGFFVSPFLPNLFGQKGKEQN